jgi:hypothetical protein
MAVRHILRLICSGCKTGFMGGIKIRETHEVPVLKRAREVRIQDSFTGSRFFRIWAGELPKFRRQ